MNKEHWKVFAVSELSEKEAWMRSTDLRFNSVTIDGLYQPDLITARSAWYRRNNGDENRLQPIRFLSVEVNYSGLGYHRLPWPCIHAWPSWRELK